METLLLVAAIFTGSVLQRVTGMGFALVAAPFIVLITGPVTGVILVNVCAALTSATVLVRVQACGLEEVSAPRPAAFTGIVPGAFVVQKVPAPWLEVFVGGTVLIALATSQMFQSSSWRPGAKPLAAAGSVSGFMNATAGVGGPALSVYALRIRWEQTEFAATMQPYFMTIGVASVAAKLAAKPSSLPELSLWVWAVIVASILAGLATGDLLLRRTGAQTARRLMFVLGYVGSIATVARGAMELLW